MKKMTLHLFFLIILIFSYEVYADKSITGSNQSYLDICIKAVDDPEIFANFRSLPEYAPILECGFHGESVEYLKTKGSQNTLNQLNVLRTLDQHGNPSTIDIPGIGRFSGTTLRYIVISDQINQIFTLPLNPKIAEIGGGFGGQCFVCSILQPFSKYYIYDLPQVESLIKKMMVTLSLNKIFLMPISSPLFEEKIDLLISNYAFSELDLEAQLDYFDRVLKKADRGYIIFNQLHFLNSLTVDQFLQLLNEHKMNPRILPEPIFTYKDNVLIIWDKTKKLE